MFNREKLAKYLDSVVTYGICCLVVLLPLYFTPIPKTASGFVINLTIDKSVFFNIFVELLLLLTLFRLVVSRKMTVFGSIKKYLLLLPFFLAIALGTFFSVDRHTSIYGFYWRQQGLLSYVHYFVFIIILALNVRSRRTVEKIIAGVLAGSFLVSLVGLLHWLDLDFLHLQRFDDVRPGSTLGQPVFLGNYLVLVSFLAVYKMKAASNFWLKASYAFVFFINALCLAVTYTRAAWLGFLFGCLLLGAYYLKTWVKRSLKPGKAFYRSLAGAAALLLLISGGVVVSQKDSLFVQRLKSSFDFSVGSVFLRFQYWQGALELIGKSPIIGYGPESQHVLFLDYYNSKWAERENINAFSDRAHNEYLDIALTSGLLGLLSYLAIIGLIISIFVKRWRAAGDGGDAQLDLALAAGLLAYSLTVFFSFSTVEISALFWLCAVILIILSDGFQQRDYPLAAISKFRLASWYGLAAIAVILSLQAVDNAYRVKADYFAVEAKFASSRGDQVATINNFIKATALNPNEELYRDYYLSELTNLKSSVITIDGGKGLDNIDFANSILEMDQGLASNYFREMRKASAYDYFVRQGKTEYLEQSKQIYEMLSKRYPNLPDPYYYLGVAYYNAKKYQEAAAAIEKVFPLLPDPNGEAVNQEHREIINRYLSQRYYMLGMAYYQLGEYRKSNSAFAKVVAANPYSVSTYEQIGWNHYKMKQLGQAISYYKRALVFAPGDFQIPLQIGRYYLEDNKPAEALRYFKMSASLNPNDATVKELIDKMKK
jgi:putative inorganic carbon (HCO3(-)) transporter